MGATTVRQAGQASNARGEPMTRKASTAPRSLVALQRQQRAIELRRAGRSYREIARQVGIGVASAHRLITAAIADVRAIVQDDAAEIRALELSRLDGLLGALWPKARQGDLGAVDRVLRIMERRAKLLGLDAPVKVARTNAMGGEGATAATSCIVQVPPAVSIADWLARFGPSDAAPGAASLGRDST